MFRPLPVVIAALALLLAAAPPLSGADYVAAQALLNQ